MSSNLRNDLLKALGETDDGGHLDTILNFYAFDLEKLKNCYQMVRHCVEKELQARVQIESYGSVMTGLALKESDIDFCLTPSTDPPILYDEVVTLLRRSKCFYRVTPIRKARVPIIRCWHIVTGISIDLNMSNPHGVYNSRFVAELLNCDKRLRELFLFLKIWATKLELIGRRGLSSHCLVCMIIFSLQVRELLPSVEEMQSTSPPIIFQGNNFAYNLKPPPIIPKDITTRQLITDFFDYYSTLDFEKFVVSPFLGRCLNGNGEQLGFKLGFKKICVQDPFELNLNLAKSFNQQKLHYFRQCLMLSAQAYRYEDLMWQPKKLYDYLLFGIKQMLENAENEQIIKQPSREPIIMQKDNIKPINNNQNNIKKKGKEIDAPMMMSMMFFLNQEDYQGLLPIRECVIAETGIRATYITWRSCYLATIRDVLTQVYGLKIESEESGIGCLRMLFSGKVDTWSGRNFTPAIGQSFLSHQLHQSSYFSKIRRGNPAYAVNVTAYLTVLSDEKNKVLQIEMKPLSGPQKNRSVEKLFYEFSHLLNKYSFKEQASIWSLDPVTVHRGEIFQIFLLVLGFATFIIPVPLLLIMLLLMAIQFWDSLKSFILNYVWETQNFKKNELNPKYPIYR